MVLGRLWVWSPRQLNISNQRTRYSKIFEVQDVKRRRIVSCDTVSLIVSHSSHDNSSHSRCLWVKVCSSWICFPTFPFKFLFFELLVHSQFLRALFIGGCRFVILDLEDGNFVFVLALESALAMPINIAEMCLTHAVVASFDVALIVNLKEQLCTNLIVNDYISSVWGNVTVYSFMILIGNTWTYLYSDFEVRCNSRPTSICFHGGNKIFLGDADGNINFIDLLDGRILKTLSSSETQSEKKGNDLGTSSSFSARENSSAALSTASAVRHLLQIDSFLVATMKDCA